MKRLLILAILALPAFAQNYVATTGNVSVSAATYAATLQAPAASTGSTKTILLQTATVYCSAACVLTLSFNCTTAATATAGTTVPLPGSRNTPSSATFWTASNASGCTAIETVNIPAGATYEISLSTPAPMSLRSTGTTNNYHFSFASVTATVNVVVKWEER